MHEKFPTNVIRNQKYNVVSFLPLVCSLLSRNDLNTSSKFETVLLIILIL